MTPDRIHRAAHPAATRPTPDRAQDGDPTAFLSALNDRRGSADSTHGEPARDGADGSTPKPAVPAGADTSLWAFMAGIPMPPAANTTDEASTTEQGIAPGSAQISGVQAGAPLPGVLLEAETATESPAGEPTPTPQGETATKPPGQNTAGTILAAESPDPAMFAAATETGTVDGASFAALPGLETTPGSVRSQTTGSDPQLLPGLNPSTQAADPPARTAPANTAGPQTAPDLRQPVGQGAWREELGTHVLWQADNKLATAELRLNPAHLGPMEVSIQFEREGASVRFSAQNQAVREAIEAAVPKLREMFGAQQIALNEVSVNIVPPTPPMPQQGQGFDFQRQSRFIQPGRAGHGSGAEIPEDGLTVETGRSLAISGSVNFYA